MTTQLSIRADRHSYPVVVGASLRQDMGQWLKDLKGTPKGNIFIITDSHVEQLGYLRDVSDSLRRAGFTVDYAVIPPGDQSKSLSMAETLYNAMLDAGIRRDGLVVALGGGVVGDLAGFVAATYLRGIPFVQVPTTLLAHDSSIGGKVGINLPKGKNLVGAFHAPLAVLYDTDLLASLPISEWRSGMAEVIKHAVIADAQLFASLEDEPLTAPAKGETMEEILSRAIAVKQMMVEADEREAYNRMVLNLGHTVGHAVEQFSQYTLSHGAAVAIGMVVEGRLAVLRNLLRETDWLRIRAVLAAHGLPVTAPDYPFDAIANILLLDKKNDSAATLTVVLPEGIGKVGIYRDILMQEIEKCYEEMTKEFRG